MITLEIFKALCTFDQVIPQFLNLIFGLGRKTKSFDEDYMACYYQFSAGREVRSEALAEKRDQDHSQGSDEKLQAKSYGQGIFTSPFEVIVVFLSQSISYSVTLKNSYRRFMLQHPPFRTTRAGP